MFFWEKGNGTLARPININLIGVEPAGNVIKKRRQVSNQLNEIRCGDGFPTSRMKSKRMISKETWRGARSPNKWKL
jgi:hypothetical protein